MTWGTKIDTLLLCLFLLLPFDYEVSMHIFRQRLFRKLVLGLVLGGTVLLSTGCSGEYLILRRFCDGSIGFPYNDYCRDAK